jgi:hypothetical protein
MCHLTAAKLQLYTHFVSALQKFFAVADLSQVIMFIDVYPEFDFLELRSRRPSIFLVLGEIVTEFSQGNDFADWRTRSRCDLNEIEFAILSFTQGVGQFHDAELLPAGTQDNPDFAGANPTVYTKLWLQIKSISWPARRECAGSP